MKISGERLLSDLEKLKSFTDTPGAGVTRFSYGENDRDRRRDFRHDDHGSDGFGSRQPCRGYAHEIPAGCFGCRCGVHWGSGAHRKSGPVHDTCVIAPHIPSGMLFVPSIGGRSHVPFEDTAPGDLVTGAQLLLDAVLNV